MTAENEPKKEEPQKAANNAQQPSGKAAFVGGASPRPSGTTGATPKEEKKPEGKKPEFKIPEPDLSFFSKLYEGAMRLAQPLSKLIVKGALVLTVLTGFAKKETQQSVDGEPPKATLTVGTMGMRLMKASINNGDKSTDFDANMILAQGAKEVVGKVFPEKDQDKFFEEKPIENGVFGKEAQDALSKVPAKDASAEVADAGTAKEDSPRKGPSPLTTAAGIAGVAALALAASTKTKSEKKDEKKPAPQTTQMTVADMARVSGKGPANRS